MVGEQPASFPVVAGGSLAQSKASRGGSADDELCEVFTESEFQHRVTDLLLDSVPELTGGQIVTLRTRLLAFAQGNGWVD